MLRFFKHDVPAHITVANLIGFALTFLAVPLIARSIGPAGRGETAAALAAFAIAPTILGLGVPLELRRRSSAVLDQSSTRAARDLVLLSLAPAALLGGAFVLTVYSDLDRSLQLSALAGLALLAPVSVSWACDTGILMGQGRYRAVALIRIAHPSTTLIAIGAGALSDRLTPSGVLWASMLATLATGILGYALNRAAVVGKRSSRSILLKQGSRFAGSAIAESASARLDQVLTLPLIGAAAAGQYSIASSMALLPLALGQALGADHFRAVAQAQTEEEAVRLSHKAVREALAVSLPACLIYAAVASPLIPLVFGSAFVSAVNLFWILIPGSVCLTAGFVATLVLAARERGKTMSLIQVGGLAVGVALLLLLGPTMGAGGAAAASTAAYIFVLGAQMCALRATLHDVLPRWSDLRAGSGSLFARGGRL